jgi:hypothetical protein
MGSVDSGAGRVWVRESVPAEFRCVGTNDEHVCLTHACVTFESPSVDENSRSSVYNNISTVLNANDMKVVK